MGEESHGLRLLVHVLGRLKAGGDRAATDIDGFQQFIQEGKHLC